MLPCHYSTFLPFVHSDISDTFVPVPLFILHCCCPITYVVLGTCSDTLFIYLLFIIPMPFIRAIPLGVPLFTICSTRTFTICSDTVPTFSFVLPDTSIQIPYIVLFILIPFITFLPFVPFCYLHFYHSFYHSTIYIWPTGVPIVLISTILHYSLFIHYLPLHWYILIRWYILLTVFPDAFLMGIVDDLIICCSLFWYIRAIHSILFTFILPLFYHSMPLGKSTPFDDTVRVTIPLPLLRWYHSSTDTILVFHSILRSSFYILHSDGDLICSFRY